LPSNPTRQKEEEEKEKEEKETRVSLPFSFCKAKIGKKMMTRITRDHQREFVSKKKVSQNTRTFALFHRVLNFLGIAVPSRAASTSREFFLR